MVCLLFCLVLLCSACSPAVHPSQSPSADRTQELSENYASGWGYRCLDEQQQKNYAAIYTAVYDGISAETRVQLAGEKTTLGLSVTLPQPLSGEQQAKQLYEVFLQDNPQFFHLGGRYSFDGRQVGERKEFTTLTLTYTMNAQQRENAAKELETVVQAILNDMPDGGDFEKELYLHDTLSERCGYDEKAAVSESPLEEHPASFTAYGALVNGMAVCEGYSRAMQYLLLRAGMEATVITGFDAQKRAHMWNVVRINGEPYHLDVTWDDQKDKVTHTYFNLSDEVIRKTHQTDDKTLGLLKMSATAGQYYVYTKSKLQTTRLEQVAAFFADRLNDGKTIIDVQFTKEGFHNALFFIRSKSWFAETVNADIKEGTEPLDNYEYVYDETYYTITIYKK